MAAPFPSPTKTWHTTTYAPLSPLLPTNSATGKTVLITGGGTGIGAATALSFAAAGALKLILLGRRPAPLLATKSRIEAAYPETSVLTAATDITNCSAVDTAFALLGPTGKIDVLVSNAASIGPQDAVATVPAAEFLDSISTNLAGALNIAQAFLLRAAPDAVVIDINSSAAHVNFAPVFAAYSIAKFAVYRLWDSVGFAHPELRVFHVQPGVVNTDMNKEAGGVAAMGFEDHESLPATFCVFLASPSARFLKGKFLWANWDVDELKERAAELEGGQTFNIQLIGWPFGQEQQAMFGEWEKK